MRGRFSRLLIIRGWPASENLIQCGITCKKVNEKEIKTWLEREIFIFDWHISALVFCKVLHPFYDGINQQDDCAYLKSIVSKEDLTFVYFSFMSRTKRSNPQPFRHAWCTYFPMELELILFMPPHRTKVLKTRVLCRSMLYEILTIFSLAMISV